MGSFFKRGIRRRLKQSGAVAAARPPFPMRAYYSKLENSADVDCNLTMVKGKKKMIGSRLWMRFDKFGNSETIECYKSDIIKRVSLPSRDLRMLGPIFSYSSTILAREKSMVINLDHIRAIVTAEEVLILDPLRMEVLPFIDQLRRQIPQHPSKMPVVENADFGNNETRVSSNGRWLPVSFSGDDLQGELCFEFQVLEVVLQIICVSLNSSVAHLERVAYPLLDELTRNVSTKNLDQVRSLKSNLTCLLARVQKVRDEIEHLLDDDGDMADLYLTRKLLKNQQSGSLLGCISSDNIVPSTSHLCQLSCSTVLDDNDVDDLEMLLEAYFLQLDGIRNKILSVREYIDDTEDYVNIQLDNQRNGLLELKVKLIIAAFVIAIETLVASIFGMNFYCPWTKRHAYGIFGYFVGIASVASLLLFLHILAEFKRKKLLES